MMSSITQNFEEYRMDHQMIQTDDEYELTYQLMTLIIQMMRTATTAAHAPAINGIESWKPTVD